MKTIFSPDRIYRYTLYREWGTGPVVNFICLNPSTADEERNDPTVRRCIGYARDWGFDRMMVTNIFALRSTDPSVLKTHPEPIGAENNAWIERMARSSDLIVCAWGGIATERGDFIKHRLSSLLLHYLRLTPATERKHAFPHHPLYLPKSLKPVEWV